jgi:hypothetical protein
MSIHANGEQLATSSRAGKHLMLRSVCGCFDMSKANKTGLILHVENFTW